MTNEGRTNFFHRGFGSRRFLIRVPLVIILTIALSAAVVAQQPERSSDKCFRDNKGLLDCRTCDCDQIQWANALFKEVEIGKGVGLNVLNVAFATNSATIDTQYKKALNALGEALALQQYAERRIQISGHTDSIGRRDKNQQLSLRRAESVKQYLIDNYRVSPQRLVTKGFGPDQPLCGDNTPVCLKKNRRVEVVGL